MLATHVPAATWVRRVMHAALLLFAANTAVLTILAVADVQCSPSWLLAAYLGVLGIASLLQPPPEPARIADRDDVLAAGLGLLTALILLGPLLHATPGQTLAFTSQTTDGGNYAQLVLGTQKAGGYFTLPPPAGVLLGMKNYPPAWAGNAWLFGSWATSQHLSPIGSVRVVGAFGVCSYAALTMASARLALFLSRILAARGRSRQVPPVALVAGIATFGWGLFILNLAAYTEVMALLATTALLLVQAEDNVPTNWVIWLAAAQVEIVSQTWYVMLPVAAGVAAVAVLARRPSLRQLVATSFISAPFVLFSIATGPGASQISAGGPEMLPVLLGIVGMLAATGVAVRTLLLRRPRSDSLRLCTATAIVLSLLLVVALVVVQPKGTPGASYYTAKMLLAVMWLGGTAASGAFGGWQRLRSSQTIAVLGIVTCFITTAHAVLPPRAAQTNGQLRSADLDVVLSRHPGGVPRSTDIWLIDGCNRVGDLVASKWFYDLSLTWTRARAEALDAYTLDKDRSVDAVKSRAADPAVASIEVYVSPRNCQNAHIEELGLLPKVSVFHVP